jgi:hypothetical protein
MLEMSGNDRFDNIASAKGVRKVFRFGFAAWKSPFIHEAHLAASMPLGGNEQWFDLADLEQCRGAHSYAGRVTPVRFGQVAADAVILRPAAAATLHREPGSDHSLEEDPACRIDSRCVLKGGFGLSQDTLEEIRLVCQEDDNILSPLTSIAGFTGQTEITDAVSPPISSGLNMLYLQGHILLATITTRSVPLLQQILTAFISCKCPLLVLEAL